MPMTTSTPSTPVSTAMRASSIWQRMWVRILAFRPSLQMASQSFRDCSEAAGEVSSRYSTPNLSRDLAMAILVSVSKKALANCSPSAQGRISRSEVAEMTRTGTSESALDDFKVRNVVQEVGCPRCIWVALLLRRCSIDTVGPMVTIRRASNSDHILRIFGRRTASLMITHSVRGGLQPDYQLFFFVAANFLISNSARPAAFRSGFLNPPTLSMKSLWGINIASMSTNSYMAQ